MRESIYTTSSSDSLHDLLESLTALLPVRRRAIPAQLLTLFDTFDGRLARAGARLESLQENGSLELEWWAPDGERPRHARLSEPIHFAWDLPQGPLRGELEPVIEMRRLLPTLVLERKGTVLDVLDERQKTVARVRFEHGRVRSSDPSDDWHALPPLLRLVPVRGYDQDFERLRPVVESRPGLVACEEDVLDLAARTAGRDGCPRPSAPRLERGMPAGEGVRAILLGLLETALACEGGLRADLDTEFVHDFRVAIRRSRSILGQVRKVFPADVVNHFRGELKWLGTITGPTRDADVFLLHLRDGSLDLPEEDVAVLWDFLVAEQAAQQRRMLEHLDTDRYRTLVTGWRDVLSSPIERDPALANAARPLEVVVGARISKLYRRLASEGPRAGHEASTEELHALRLDAKKLRYLIDCTAPIFGHASVGVVRKALRSLQNVLGDFNDAQVQQARIAEYGSRMADAGLADARTLVTLGRLSEKVRKRGERSRGRFAKRFARFTSSDTRKRFRKLFAKTARRGKAS